MTYPAFAQVIPLASRSWRIRAPSTIRTTAGPTGPSAVSPVPMPPPRQLPINDRPQGIQTSPDGTNRQAAPKSLGATCVTLAWAFLAVSDGLGHREDLRDPRVIGAL